MNCDHMNHSELDNLFLPSDYIKLRQKGRFLHYGQ